MTDADKQLENIQESMTQSDAVTLDATEIPEEIDDAETLFSSSFESEAVEEALPEIDNAQAGEGVQAETLETHEQESTPEAETTIAAELEVANLTQVLEETKAQLEERNSQYMRMAADFDNYRRRTTKEKDEVEQRVQCNTISELLPVVDNFERARLQLKPQTDAEINIHKSYQSVYKQLVDSLKRIGVSPMRAEGKLFDPSLHEAVVREATNEVEEGTVLEELVRGYLLGERVLRHALVKVAVPAEESEVSNDNGGGDE